MPTTDAPTTPVKPRLRGVLHQYAFLVSLLTGAGLVLAAPTGRAMLAVTIYAISVSALFGVSALYHRVHWSPAARRWMGRLDHSMICVLIAGSFTPFGMLALSGTFAVALLAIVWGGAVAGIGLHLLWYDAPKWLSAVLYVVLGWTGSAAVPQLAAHVGWTATGLVGLGGVIYTAGAAVYALRRPDPIPEVFGYHEVFHALVIVAAVVQYAVVAVYVLPSA
ncbi:MAG: hemolysin III family protein [Candidatus Binatia bacterium]